MFLWRTDENDPLIITKYPLYRTESYFFRIQENNAMAEIDWQRNQITRIKGLGFKDHNVAGQGLDPSDEDGGKQIPHDSFIR